MSTSLGSVVRFRGDKLFNGAVSIDWFDADEKKAAAAATAFVFHGPTYHGVSQADVGSSHGHRLQDSASFVKAVVDHCYGLDDVPFTLAIAGYGTGKSHLALTIGRLLDNPTGSEADSILAGLAAADQNIAANLRTLLTDTKQPCLVLALNGMRSVDLASETTRQIIHQVQKRGLNTRPLDELRPRFKQAESLLRMAKDNLELINAVLSACDASTVDEIIAKLQQQDDAVYRQVNTVLEQHNIRISAYGGESVRDVIDLAAREYCGVGKAFKSILILFDEFGRYTEFATTRSHIAGSGALQDLFEAVQNNTGKVCFVGFIQFELNAYVQLVAVEHRNEIMRYVTRYQTANKAFLSINLETLIANLIEKRDVPFLDSMLNTDAAREESMQIMSSISKWFPSSQHHHLWQDDSRFHNVVRKGCWPLSPYAVWLLFHLAAAGKHLQERSVLALLGETFDRFQNYPIDGSKSSVLWPVDLLTESLQHELISSEESGQQGAITHSYASAMARHGMQFMTDHIRILQAIVLAAKMGLRVSHKNDATAALAALAGLSVEIAAGNLQELSDEFNIVEWDQGFKQFDILGDAVPKAQFLAYIRQRVNSTYDVKGKANLFSSKAKEWCDDLGDRECDFGEENKISTTEWRYQAVTSHLDLVNIHIKAAVDQWLNAFACDQPRGTVIYCYVEPNRDFESVERQISQQLRAAAKDAKVAGVPILVVLLVDDEGKLGQALAEIDVMKDKINPQDAVKFGHLIAAHEDKMLQDLKSRLDTMIKERHYVTAFSEPLMARRLDRVCSEIFARVYPKPVIFPFDGFGTARGNAAKTCLSLTTELMLGRLDWNAVMAKPSKDQNRASTVLKDAWGIYAKNGSVRPRPENPILKSVAEKWEQRLSGADNRLHLGEAIRGLCAPPYGANIASAGLFLGAFLAARTDKVAIVKNDQTIAVSEWLNEGAFKGAFLDLNGLHDVVLFQSGEMSSEWEVLLDEWEQVETYSAQKECFLRGEELKKRIPLPTTLGYKRETLIERLKTAMQQIKVVEDEANKAIRKTEEGLEKQDAGLLSWGLAELVTLQGKMKAEMPRWTDAEIDGYTPTILERRQELIEIFPAWLPRQMPRNESPDVVGQFKQMMIRKICPNLETLNLHDLSEALNKHTMNACRQAELFAVAGQTIREVDLWLTSNQQPLRPVRIAQLRALKKTGPDYAKRLKLLAASVELPDLPPLRSKLSGFLDTVEAEMDKVDKRASALWQNVIASYDDLEQINNEVNELFAIYEGCPADLEDFQAMRQALRVFMNAYRDLENDLLTPDEYVAHAAKISADVQEQLADAELPWDPVETMAKFCQQQLAEREHKAATWLAELEERTAKLAELSAAEVSTLHARVAAAPAVLSASGQERQRAMLAEIEGHLSKLAIEWLVERFRQLSPEQQQAFLATVGRGR